MFIPDPGAIPPTPPPLYTPSAPPVSPIPPVLVPVQPDAGSLPTAWGSNVKFVTCTWCGHHFCYRMSRTVQGRSRDRAEARIRKVLQVEYDPVPCPSCGNYQPDMIRLLKRRHRPGLCLAGLGLLVAGNVACAVAWGMGWPGWPVVAIVPAAGSGLLLLWFKLVRCFDPNAPAGAEARKATGKQAEVVVPLGGVNGTAFVVAPDGAVSDVRYMNVQSSPSQ